MDWGSRALFALTLAAAVPGVAAAQDAPRSPVALEWIAPEGCPDAAIVNQRVARLLRHAPPQPTTGTALTARAEVARAASGEWQLRLTTATATATDGSGERTLRGDSCMQVARAAALILAMVLDPDVVDEPEPPAPIPAPPRVNPPPRAGPTPPRIQMLVRASMTGEVGTMPAVDPRPAFTLGIAGGRFRAELTATTGFAQDARDPLAFVARLHRVFAVEAQGCAAPLIGVFEVGVCAAAEVGWVDARGVSTGGRAGGAATLALLARGVLAWNPVRWFGVRLDVAAGANVLLPQFVVEGSPSTQVHQPAIPTGRAGLGLEARFP